MNTWTSMTFSILEATAGVKEKQSNTVRIWSKLKRTRKTLLNTKGPTNALLNLSLQTSSFSRLRLEAVLLFDELFQCTIRFSRTSLLDLGNATQTASASSNKLPSSCHMETGRDAVIP
ncbi:hypothetical protein E1B28_011721 [Marasmius oreades]|uniref:Uncharacterized protein n=1 Tax=Marasmius oreades TaxID=181124 RepID=A0A9P7USE2_9AGAR|nr:uncharacterized protein E1B28_011721 [Marasmius oreades]KAG7090109.1 hypothetical protein E1B28_011721 [Marasmius oreades]